MLTRQSWKSYTDFASTMTKEDKSSQTRKHLQNSIGDILKIMSSVNPTLILMLKTNDLLIGLQNRFCSSVFPLFMFKSIIRACYVSLVDKWTLRKSFVDFGTQSFDLFRNLFQIVYEYFTLRASQ